MHLTVCASNYSSLGSWSWGDYSFDNDSLDSFVFAIVNRKFHNYWVGMADFDALLAEPCKSMSEGQREGKRGRMV